jgi:hypothetical protein
MLCQYQSNVVECHIINFFKKKLKIKNFGVVRPFGHGVAWPPPFGRFGGGQQPHSQMEVAETTPSWVAHPLAMGFPAFSVMNPSGERALSKSNTIDEVLWKGIHEKLNLYESDRRGFCPGQYQSI